MTEGWFWAVVWGFLVGTALSCFPAVYRMEPGYKRGAIVGALLGSISAAARML